MHAALGMFVLSFCAEFLLSFSVALLLLEQSETTCKNSESFSTRGKHHNNRQCVHHVLEECFYSCFIVFPIELYHGLTDFVMRFIVKRNIFLYIYVTIFNFLMTS